MKYLCAVYLEPNALQGLSAGEQAKLNRDSLDYNDELAKKGHYIAASALQPPRTAKTVRHRGGKSLVTDGPYAESKEVPGGFIPIEARDMQGGTNRGEYSRGEICKHRGAAGNEDWIERGLFKMSNFAKCIKTMMRPAQAERVKS